VTPGTGRIRFLLDPGAGNGRAGRRLDEILRADPRLRERSDVVEVRTVSEAVRAIRDGGRGTVAVAAGGDGTANRVAQALLEADVTGCVLGVVPLGTGNAFAHSLGVGRIGPALEALAAGTIRRIDVMRTSHPDRPLALVSLSAGFEADFIQRYTRWRGRGRPLAAVAAALCGAARPAHTLRITLDGEPFVEPTHPVHNAGLYNLPCYAAGKVLWPDADGGDGRGEAVACRSRRRYWGVLLRGLSTAEARSRGDPLARRWRRAELAVDGPIQVDGETAPGWTGSAWIEERALPVLTAALPVGPSPKGGPVRKIGEGPGSRP
jgi:diacylglycerol kinase (ATP)